jgi:hypothetical protein
MRDMYAVVLQYCIVPLLVSNIHDIILVHTQYVLVCTSLYYYTFVVPVCTWYVQVRTGSEQVRTKYPIPVMLFTIPDDGWRREGGSGRQGGQGRRGAGGEGGRKVAPRVGARGAAKKSGAHFEI